MARTYKRWDIEDGYFETKPSENVKKCAGIVVEAAMNENQKIEMLKNILRYDPACVHEKLLFRNNNDSSSDSDSEDCKMNTGTLLNLAVSYLYRGIAHLLLQYGADPNACDRENQSPAGFVHDAMLRKDCSEYESFEFFKLLLSYEADLKIGVSLDRILCNPFSNRIMRLLMEYSAEDAKKYLKRCLNFLYGQRNVLVLVKCLLAQNPDRRKPSFLSDYESLSKHWDNCKAEAQVERDLINKALLKNTTITVHDISVAEERMLANYVRNNVIEQLSTKCMHLYPLYGPMIERQYQKGWRRMTLENQVQIVMKHWQPSLCNFYICQKILQNLELHDMRYLREAGILVLNSNA